MTTSHTLGRITYEKTSGFDYGSYAFWIPGVCTSIDDEATARRLVACWNACEGLSTEDIEQFTPIAVLVSTKVSELMFQRDELLEALKSAWLWMENQSDAQSKGGHATFDLMMLRYERDMARAAIAKAGGKT